MKLFKVVNLAHVTLASDDDIPKLEDSQTPRLIDSKTNRLKES